MTRPVAALVALVVLAAAPAAGAYDPASQPPFGGEPVPPLTSPERPDRPPPGFELTALEATAIADHTPEVDAELAESPEMESAAYTRGPGRWEVKYFVSEDGGRTEVAQVHVNDASGEVLEAWRDHQVETKLARGYDGAVGRSINSPWIWVPLCLLFVAPFFDPRRPFRLVHLDLHVLVKPELIGGKTVPADELRALRAFTAPVSSSTTAGSSYKIVPLERAIDRQQFSNSTVPGCKPASEHCLLGLPFIPVAQAERRRRVAHAATMIAI